MAQVDPNAMNTSAMVRKATTEADKQKHRDKGRCFKCSQRGHLARVCPNKQSCTKATSSVETKDKGEEKENLTKGAKLAKFALHLSDQERDAFVKRVASIGEEMGFLEA